MIGKDRGKEGEGGKGGGMEGSREGGRGGMKGEKVSAVLTCECDPLPQAQRDHVLQEWAMAGVAGVSGTKQQSSPSSQTIG